MKLLALSLLFISGLAHARYSTLEINGTVTGTVKFETKWTATCAALGCPKSKAYTEVSLVNAEVSGYGTVSKVTFDDPTLRELPTPVSFVVLKGTRLKQGLKVSVKGSIWLRKYSFVPLENVVIQSIDSIKLVR